MNCALLILLPNLQFYKSLKKSSFFVNKSIKIKKPALLTTKRAHYKGGIIMKKIVLLFVASILYGLQTIIN